MLTPSPEKPTGFPLRIATIAVTVITLAALALGSSTVAAEVPSHQFAGPSTKAGVTPPPTAAQRALVDQELDWQPCPNVSGYECTTMKAPLDYDHPAGVKIDVAVIRHRAGDLEQRRGTIFWNAGGPGGAPTSALPGTLPLFAPSMRKRFDVVAVDPRGIGGSTPLRCFDKAGDEAALLSGLPPGFPVGATQVRRAVNVYKKLGQVCARDGGAIQRHMSTANVARDMNLLRMILKVGKLNYYGPSYGSYLGATYINLFPATAGRMVLDGNVPPEQWNGSRSNNRINTFSRINSPNGAARGLRLFLSECGAAHVSRCAFSAGTPSRTERKFRSLLRRVQTKPVTLEGVPFTYAQSASLTGSLLASQNKTVAAPGWRDLAALLQTAWRQTRSTTPVSVSPGTKTLLSTLAQSQSGASPVGTLGVVCGESPNPRDPYAYPRQGLREERNLPYGLGRVWTWLAQPCAGWKATDADRYRGPWDKGTSPVLLIGTLADSNTAYKGSVRMSRQLNRARLLTETGGGHTAMLNKSTCVDRFVDRYLLTGALPKPGTVCDQNRQPF